MKKSIIILLLMPSLFFAQQSLFDKFEGNDDITTVIVNKKMFQMMSSVKMDAKDAEAQRYLNMVKNLNSLKVFTTSNPKIANDLKSTADKYIKSATMEELMRVNDGGQLIKIMIKSGNTETKVKELMMMINGASAETVILSLTGDFDLNDLSVLTDKMNLPGSKALQKAAKTKK